jgi:hypothetical protein
LPFLHSAQTSTEEKDEEEEDVWEEENHLEIKQTDVNGTATINGSKYPIVVSFKLNI